MRKNEIYKNAPLLETVFEIKFPGEPAIECKRDIFYEKIRNVYSKVLVPRAVEGKAMALEPYKFEREYGTYGIMLAINKFSVYCEKYKGFKIFKKEVIKLLSIFGELFNIKQLSRTGLRYIILSHLSAKKKLSL